MHSTNNFYFKKLGAPLALSTLLLSSTALADATTTYQYDELGRLKSVTHQRGEQVDYQYDDTGNRVSGTISGVAAPSVFDISNGSVTEGGNLTFTVTRSDSLSGTVSVDFATADGTATELSGDYISQTGTVTFLDGETSKTIVILTGDDTDEEADETLSVTLSNPFGGTILNATATGTILNDDIRPALFTVADTSATEGQNLTFTLTRSEGLTGTVSVDYQTGDGSATLAAGDYTTTTGTATFLEGETTKTVTVATNDDADYETDETILLTLINPIGGTIGDTEATGTINNNDTAYSIGDTAVEEGVGFTFNITRLGDLSTTGSVNYATSDGTATLADNDYEANLGTVTFLPSEVTKTVTILTTEDTIEEADETITVTLSAPVNGSLLDATATGTIQNDDIDPAEFSIGNIGATEGSNLTFTVTRAAGLTGPVSVDYETNDGTATVADSDYTSSSGTLSFLNGETSKTISVTTGNDGREEADETFTVTLTNPIGGSITQATAIGTIQNDDIDPATFAASDASVTEGGQLSFTVTRAAGLTGTVTVNYATQDGAATAVNDYVANSGVLTFLGGETTKTVLVNTVSDETPEPTETFSLILSNPVGGSITDASGTGEILDDDPLFVLTQIDTENVETHEIKDLNGDNQTDIVGDYANGVWFYDQAASSWNHLLTNNVDSLQVIDITEDGQNDIVADVGQFGLYRYDQPTNTWTQMLTNDLARFVAVRPAGFTGTMFGLGDFGVYRRTTGNSWTQLLTNPVDDLKVVDWNNDGVDDVFALLTGGLLALYDGASGGWSVPMGSEQVFSINVADVNNDGKDDLVADRRISGITVDGQDGRGLIFVNNNAPIVTVSETLTPGATFSYSGFERNWIYSGPSDSIQIGDYISGGAKEIVGDFGNDGIKWYNYATTVWSTISTSNPDSIQLSNFYTADARQEVTADFNTSGIQIYDHDSQVWTQLITNDVDTFTATDFDQDNKGDILMDGGINGYWRYETSQ